LLRVTVVATSGVPSLAVDPRHRLPGRGAYLHVDQGCLAKAERRRAFTRALRVAVVLDTGALAAHVASQAALGRQGQPTVDSIHPNRK
jgi:predicted RNA-binding protein YlxR (DUF448 family)